MMLYIHFEALKNGNERQQSAYAVISELGVLRELAVYRPLLCGTIPLGIDVAGSDLDIIMQVETDGFHAFSRKVTELYGALPGFRIKEKEIRGLQTVKANFDYGGFPFELFGQPQPAERQYAYLHMVVEAHLLRQSPDIKEEIISLKKAGVKTEPAFAQVLRLDGDPYEALLALGREMNVI